MKTHFADDDTLKYIAELELELAKNKAEAALPEGGDARDYKEMWLDLIMQVGNKYPGESRHETAKRYILRAEDSGNNAAGCVSMQHLPAKEGK